MVESVYDASEIQNRFFFYGQDNWRMASKLTVNYDLMGNLSPRICCRSGKGANISATTGEVLLARVSGLNDSLNVIIPRKR